MDDKTPMSDSNGSSLKTDNSKEIEAYAQICNTASSSIRWLIFAVAVCSGVIALCLATFYFGNLNFAIKRRGEIKRACWEQTNNDYEHKVCLINSMCYGLDETDNNNSLEGYKNLLWQTYIVSLPVVNLKIVITDFAPIVILIGLFFWYWLWHTLIFTRDVLCSFYNGRYLTEPVTHTISAYFLLLWSGGARRNLSNISQVIFSCFLIMIVAVIFSDYYDNYINPGALAHIKQPGWDLYWPYVWSKIFFEVILLRVGLYLFFRTNSAIKDIRNLLVLIEWSQRALYPLLYKVFKKLGKSLKKRANEVSYEEDEKGEFVLKFRLKLKRGENAERGSFANSTMGVIFSAPVNLVKKAKEFSKRKHKDRKAFDWMLTEKEQVGIGSTFEQRRMKRFFFEFLCDEDFGGEFSKEFYSKVIVEYDLRDQFQILKAASNSEPQVKESPKDS